MCVEGDVVVVHVHVHVVANKHAILTSICLLAQGANGCFPGRGGSGSGGGGRGGPCMPFFAANAERIAATSFLCSDL